MYSIIKSYLFRKDPEEAHYFVLNNLKWISKLPFAQKIITATFESKKHNNPKTVMGLQFDNVVGLAAGLDKNAEYIDELALLGFGHIEIGTVTPLAQPGNERPRLFRLTADNGIINRMGFNNKGIDYVVEQLKKRKNKKIIIGGNIGKNKLTPNEKAAEDYAICFEKLFDWVDYFVVNVSSPNTPNLRELQDKKPLLHILSQLQKLNAEKPRPKPILLKIAPDLSEAELDDIVAIINETKITGVIATNTTITRENLISPASLTNEVGGLSGRPLTEKSNKILEQLRDKLGKEVVLIGVGGIMNDRDALEKIMRGADLVQIYTGFIYNGPNLIAQIKKVCQSKA
ncbi:quinone-dependent dihydroorotate dehydrogenase [Vaginella massiliensis]|uniref:quinone-dependent dihydroorotate dehydrogenase n=1 Tax=Vaginella massiliensis TaxID=1816680 RepID=UPI0037521108